MSSLLTWWSRLAAALTGAVLALVVPVHAWAVGTGTAEVAVEAVKYRRRGGFGLLGAGALCCLLVVAAIILAVVLVRRNRRGRG